MNTDDAPDAMPAEMNTDTGAVTVLLSVEGTDQKYDVVTVTAPDGTATTEAIRSAFVTAISVNYGADSATTGFGGDPLVATLRTPHGDPGVHALGAVVYATLTAKGLNCAALEQTPDGNTAPVDDTTFWWTVELFNKRLAGGQIAIAPETPPVPDEPHHNEEAAAFAALFGNTPTPEPTRNQLTPAEQAAAVAALFGNTADNE